jgi:hypothetical protein
MWMTDASTNEFVFSESFGICLVDFLAYVNGKQQKNKKSIQPSRL